MNIKRYFEQAEKLFKSQKYSQAIGPYTSIIKTDINCLEAYYGRGRSFFELAEYEKASLDFKQCTLLQGDHPEFYYWWGRSLYQIAENEPITEQTYFDVADIFKTTIEVTNNHIYFLAQLDQEFNLIIDNLVQQKQPLTLFTRIITLFLETLEITKTETERINELQADSHYWCGRAFYKIAKDNEAIEQFENCISLQPDHIDAHYWLGQVFYVLTEFTQAVDKFKDCIQIQKENYDYVDIYFWWGQALYSQAKDEEAIEKFEKCIEIRPDYAKAYYYLGNCFYNLKRDEEAVEKFEKCIEIEPNYADAYYYLGNAFYSLKKDQKAAEALLKCTEIKPNYAKAYYYLGSALYGLKKYEEAAQQYQKCLEIDPDEVNAYYWLASALAWQKKYQEASQEYQTFIEKNPPKKSYISKITIDIDVYYWLGRSLLFARDDDEKAIENLNLFIEKYQQYRDETSKDNVSDLDNQLQELFSKSKLGSDNQLQDLIQKSLQDNQLKLQGIYLKSYYWLGIAWYYQKKEQKAEEMFRKYRELQPQPLLFNFYLELASAFILVKKYDQAVENYQQALKGINQLQSFIENYKNKNSIKHQLNPIEREYVTGYIKTKIEILYYWGYALEQQKKEQLAIRKYQELITFIRNEKDSEIYGVDTNEYLTSAYLRIARIQSNQKRYEEALLTLKGAKKFSHDFAHIYYSLFSIYYQQCKYQESWEILTQAVAEYEKIIQAIEDEEYQFNSFTPNSIAEYWYGNLGNIYLWFFNDYDQANYFYHQGLKIEPDNVNLLTYLMEINLKFIQEPCKHFDELKGKYEYYLESQKYYDQALKIFKNENQRFEDYSSLVELSKFLLKATKQIVTSPEEYNQIEDYLKKAIKIKENKNNAEAYTSLGFFYIQEKSFPNAVHAFQSALKFDTDNFAVWSNLAETYLKQGELDLAEKEYQQILEINPNHVNSNMGLGQVYLIMGDQEDKDTEKYDKAIEYFAKTRELMNKNLGSQRIAKESFILKMRKQKNQSTQLSNLSYLEGYAYLKKYQKSSFLQREYRFLDVADKNFEMAIQYNNHNDEAKRIQEKVKKSKQISNSNPNPLKNRISIILFILSLVIFVPSQLDMINIYQKYTGNVPIERPNEVDRSVPKFGTLPYMTLTFSSFFFAIIALYLPQITKLSFGKEGLELEKENLQQISQINLDNIQINLDNIQNISNLLNSISQEQQRPIIPRR